MYHAQVRSHGLCCSRQVVIQTTDALVSVGKIRNNCVNVLNQLKHNLTTQSVCLHEAQASYKSLINKTQQNAPRNLKYDSSNRVSSNAT